MSATLGTYLEDLRAEAGGPGSRMLLTTLGQRLARRGIDVKADAGMKLTDVLRRYPDFCSIEDHEVVFLDGPARPEDGPVELPSRGLRPDLWKARVTDHADTRFWLDLETYKITDHPSKDGPPDPEQHWRFLEVPTIPTEAQLDFVTQHLGDDVSEDVRKRLVDAGGSWHKVANDLLSPPLLQRLKTARREWVVEQTRPWLADHGLDERRFVRFGRQATHIPDRGQGVPRQGSAAGQATERALRARIVRCVQKMTLDELLELRIPSRFLIDG